MRIRALCQSAFAFIHASLVVLVAGVVVAPAVSAQQAYSGGLAARELITAPIDESNLVVLRGSSHRAARAEIDRGPVPDSMPLKHLQLVLQRPPELETQLEARIEEMQRSGSPHYRQWLSARQFAEQYGPAQADVTRVVGWLESHGFTVDGPLSSGMAIVFSGNAGQVREAFHTGIHNLDVNGQSHFAMMDDLRIPEALTPVVHGLASLRNRAPMSQAKPLVSTPNGDPYASGLLVGPGDMAAIYHYPSSQSYSGAGQTIAVVSDSDVVASDVDAFYARFGIPSQGWSQVHPSQTSNPCTDPSDLAVYNVVPTFAVEWAKAAATGATVELATCSDSDSASYWGGFVALQNLVAQDTPPNIISTGSGACEAYYGSSLYQGIVNVYQQAAAEGISVFSFTGDGGGADCDAGFPASFSGLSVSAEASTPYNVAVGGTDLADTYDTDKGIAGGPYWGAEGNAISYIPEIAWNDSCAGSLLYQLNGATEAYGPSGYCKKAGITYQNTSAGGGGASIYSTQPAWQSAFGVPTTSPAAGAASSNPRYLPDVSLFAAGGVAWAHGLAVEGTWDALDGGLSTTGGNPEVIEFGGTEFTASLMASIQALINQSQGGGYFGNPNPIYYALAGTEFGASGSSACNSSLGTGMSSACIFNDITLGDTDVPCESTTYTVNGVSTPVTAQDCYGNNDTNGVYGVLSASLTTLEPAWQAGTGWDAATGLGSINVSNLINNWNGVQTATAVASSQPGTVTQNTSVTYTATVTPALGTGVTGTVTWSANTGCAAGTLSDGQATCTTTALPVGSDSVTATYAGTGLVYGGPYFGISSGSTTQTVIPILAALTSPTPGLSTILGSTNVQFQWTTAPGASEYQLNLSAIAAGASELFLYKGTATSATAATLPGNGVKVYATLYSKINGVWYSNGYEFTESGTPTPAVLTSPTPGTGTILGTSNVTFQWNAGIDVAEYQLNLSAVAAGASELYLYKGTALTATAATLPGNAAKLYARLYSKINGAWQYNDYQYTEGGTPTPAALTSPTPGLSTVLGTSNVIFQWNAGIAVTDYQLNLSAIAAGDSELYLYKGTALTATATTLPGNGVTVYARLYSKINGAWQYNDYQYTEGGTPTAATLTSPTPGAGSILGTSNVTFQWTAGIAVTDYQLNLSAIAPGDSELYLYKGTALTATATSLPANGVTVYARLYSKINGVWQYNDYVYTEQ